MQYLHKRTRAVSNPITRLQEWSLTFQRGPSQVGVVVLRGPLFICLILFCLNPVSGMSQVLSTPSIVEPHQHSSGSTVGHSNPPYFTWGMTKNGSSKANSCKSHIDPVDIPAVYKEALAEAEKPCRDESRGPRRNAFGRCAYSVTPPQFNEASAGPEIHVHYWENGEIPCYTISCKMFVGSVAESYFC